MKTNYVTMLKKIRRDDNIISRTAKEIEDLALTAISQAEASDVYLLYLVDNKKFTFAEITKVSAKDKKTSDKLKKLVEEHNVRFADKETTKEVFDRLKRHIRGDTAQKLLKRSCRA